WVGDTNDPAFLAFKEMGTNAIRPLLTSIKPEQPSPVKRAIWKFNRMQSLVEIPTGDSFAHEEATIAAFAALGSNARPAFPALTNWLFDTNYAFASARVLAGIGSDATPSLLRALTNQNRIIR